MTTLATQLTYIVALHTRPNLGEPFDGQLEVTVAPGASWSEIAAAARRQAFALGQHIGLKIDSIVLAEEREQAW